MQTFDLLSFLERQKTFSLKAFGPHGRAIGILNHVKKELKEIEADPSDPMEWIDVVLLSLDRLWRMGKSPAEIASFLDAKLTKNENREWPDWRTLSEDDAIEHDRSVESETTARTFRVLLNELQQLTPDQLDQPVRALVDDEGNSRSEVHIHVSDEPIYSDPGGGDEGGYTLEQLKELFPNEWETIIAESHVTPVGTVFVWVDFPYKDDSTLISAKAKNCQNE